MKFVSRSVGAWASRSTAVAIVVLAAATAQGADRSPDFNTPSGAAVHQFGKAYFIVSASKDGEDFWCAAGEYETSVGHTQDRLVHRATEAVASKVKRGDLVFDGPWVAFRTDPEIGTLFAFAPADASISGALEDVRFPVKRAEKRTVGEALAACR